MKCSGSAIGIVAGAIALAGLFASPAAAQKTEAVTLTVAGPVDRQNITYECRDGADAEPTRIAVDYINMPNGNLAVVPVNGVPTVFALARSVSGSKYVSRSKVWWTRSVRGDLYDEAKDGIAGASVCKVARD